MANENVAARIDGAVVPFRDISVCKQFDLYNRATGDYIMRCCALAGGEVVELDWGDTFNPIYDRNLVHGVTAPAEPPSPPAAAKPKPPGAVVNIGRDHEIIPTPVAPVAPAAAQSAQGKP